VHKRGCDGFSKQGREKETQGLEVASSKKQRPTIREIQSEKAVEDKGMNVARRHQKREHFVRENTILRISKTEK